MASYYVYSAAGGAGTGANWANAYTTLATAISGKAAGDIFYIAHDHAESTAGAVTWTFPGTQPNPNKVICVDRTGSVPPVAADLRTTGAASTTGSNPLTINASVEFYGLILNSGANIALVASTTAAAQKYKNCSLRTTTGNTTALGNTSGTAYIEWDNTTAHFGNTAANIFIQVAAFVWKDTPSALGGSTVPTNLFTFSTTSRGGGVYLYGVDLSAAGSGKTIVGLSNGMAATVVKFLDCKLNASVTKVAAHVGTGDSFVDFVRSGSSGVNYTVHRNHYAGTLDEETTIVRTGGASDGTTPIAWKVITTANSTWAFPFECPPIAIWNDTTGSARTATIEGIWGGGAVPNDDEIWVEVEYLGDASSPQGSFVNDSKATVLTTAAGQAAGSGTWGGSTTKFALGVTFTAQQKGWLYARIRCAKPSSIFYLDPLVTLS